MLPWQKRAVVPYLTMRSVALAARGCRQSRASRCSLADARGLRHTTVRTGTLGLGREILEDVRVGSPIISVGRWLSLPRPATKSWIAGGSS
jgi:hypothetical protein